MKKGFIGFLLMAFCMPFVMQAQFKAPIAVVYDTIDTCDSYTWIDGHTYTDNSSGYYIYKDALNNDSLMVVMTFIIHKSSTADVYGESCGKYYWALSDSVYSTPGDYEFTLTNAAGCDSVVTLHFTKKNPDTIYTDVSQCAPYTWPADGNTYSGKDTNVYVVSPTAAADSCHAILCLRYKNMTIADTMFVETCESSYTWPINNTTYNSGEGVVSYRKENANSCDTLYTLKYNIGISQYILPDTNISTFGFYVWGTDSIKVDSVRIDTVLVKTFASEQGCDTTMNYNVSILPIFTIDTAFCGGSRGYRWPVSDASALINLTKTGDTTYICKGADSKDSCMMVFHYTNTASDTTWLPTVTACGSYYWDANGNTYRSSQDTIVKRLTNVLGCDSVVILTKLTINELPNIYIGGILQVRPGNSTKLFAVGDSNLTYLWSTGETTDTITVRPSENTEYSLTATNSNGCQRSSTATVVVSESINQATANSVKVFPNPASTKVTIESENLVNVKLYNMLGQQIISKNAVSGKVTIPVTDYNNGSYILRAETADGKTTIRSVVIKK